MKVNSPMEEAQSCLPISTWQRVYSETVERMEVLDFNQTSLARATLGLIKSAQEKYDYRLQRIEGLWEQVMVILDEDLKDSYRSEQSLQNLVDGYLPGSGMPESYNCLTYTHGHWIEPIQYGYTEPFVQPEHQIVPELGQAETSRIRSHSKTPTAWQFFKPSTFYFKTHIWTVEDLWDEWIHGTPIKPSVEFMDLYYGTSWRPHREYRWKKVIISEIKDAVKEGVVSLERIFNRITKNRETQIPGKRCPCSLPAFSNRLKEFRQEKNSNMLLHLED